MWSHNKRVPDALRFVVAELRQWLGKRAPPRSLASALDEVQRLYGRPIAVLAGAAVSLARPASLPTSDQFYDALAEVATGLEPRLRDSRRVAARLRSNVRFELLMEQLRRVMLETPGDPVTKLIKRAFSSDDWNSNHATIAKLLGSAVGVLTTTNFDTLMEASSGLAGVTNERDIEDVSTRLRDDPAAAANGVIHLHSSVEDPPTLGAFQRRVGRPLSGPRHELLLWAGDRMPVVLIGYAGKDVDIMPTLRLIHRPIVWLRRGRPAKGMPGVHIPTDLDPSRSSAQARARAAESIRAWLNEDLTPGDRELFVAVICSAIGNHDLALDRFRLALPDRPVGARLGFASALASLAMFGAAARTLLASAGSKYPPAEAVELLSDRAIYRRFIGEFDGAIADYRAARQQLEPDIEQRPERIPELLAVLWREVEVRVLAGVREGHRQREDARIECERILARCAELLEMDRTVPDSEQYFYHGELAMLSGRPADAAEYYRLFARSAREWSRFDADVVAAIRRAAALAAAGQKARAATVWAMGSFAAVRRLALVHIAQYVVGLPVLIGRPGYLWWSRLLATRTYPIYERVKRAVLRWRGKERRLTLEDA